MELQEKHKEFAVKSFAQFMTRKEVTNAFMEEFADDLPKPPTFPETTSGIKQNPNIEDEIDRDKYINREIGYYRTNYRRTYGDNANMKFEEDRPKIIEQIKKQYAQKIETQHNAKINKLLEEHSVKVEQHYKDIKAKLSNQLRRFNITHREFPQKYRELFNQTRNEYLINYRNQAQQNDNTVVQELETLYGFVKEHVFQSRDPKYATANIRLAHTILKTIATENKTNPPQNNDKGE